MCVVKSKSESERIILVLVTKYCFIDAKAEAEEVNLKRKNSDPDRFQIKSNFLFSVFTSIGENDDYDDPWHATRDE